MITKVTKANADKYSFLYEKATEYLMTHDVDGNKLEAGEKGGPDAILQYIREEGNPEPIIPTITSIEEYLSYILDLRTAEDKGDGVFSLLPLDEPMFEIDANTRTITVPEEFQSNGISVQGDVVSEIVYFKINRFYDAQDLYLKKIYIQWTAPSGEQGVSVPWIVDVESEPNYIIFGWPLSSEITKESGTLTFSVRFYSMSSTKDELDYSFSTLSASAEISSALDYDLANLETTDVILDDATALISNRFKPTIPSSSSAVAEEPEFSKDFDDDEDHKAKVVEDPEKEKTYVYMDLDFDDDGFRNKDFYGEVAALAPDAGAITYMVVKRRFDDEVAVDITDKKIEMIPTTDTVRVTGKLYYYKKKTDAGAGQDVQYRLYTGNLDEESVKNFYGVEDEKIYEKVFRILVDSTGYYTVTATNRVRTATKSKESMTVIVPHPLAPEFTEEGNLEESGIILPQLEDEDNANDYILVIDVDTTIEDRGRQTYQWYRKAPGETEFVAIEGETHKELSITGFQTKIGVDAAGHPMESADQTFDHFKYELLDDTGHAAGDGIYYCVITNNLNKETESVNSAEIRVTHPASKPKVDRASSETYSITEIENDGAKISVTAEIPAESGELADWRTEDDTITYEWYRYYVGDDTTVQLDYEKAEKGEYQLDHDISQWGVAQKKIEKITEDMENGVFTEEKAAQLIAEQKERQKLALSTEFIPLEAGYYFCVVTNTYNGTTASTISKFFNITNA